VRTDEIAEQITEVGGDGPVPSARRLAHDQLSPDQLDLLSGKRHSLDVRGRNRRGILHVREHITACARNEEGRIRLSTFDQYGGEETTDEGGRSCVHAHRSPKTVVPSDKFGTWLAANHRSDYYGHMERTTISQLKARLSAYLKKVRAGQTILILDRDEPVARLERVSGGGAGSGDEEAGEDRLNRLERAGLLRRATRPLNLDRLRAPALRTDTSLLQALLEERRDAR
jgi:antitoxin (DNA-binding transcriptional repressor) of toxin-antitoxin stability system